MASISKDAEDVIYNLDRAVADLAFRKEVTVQTHGLDKYGRTLADVLLPDGTNVNHALVKDGCADGIGNMRRGIRYWKS